MSTGTSSSEVPAVEKLLYFTSYNHSLFMCLFVKGKTKIMLTLMGSTKVSAVSKVNISRVLWCRSCSKFLLEGGDR